MVTSGAVFASFRVNQRQYRGGDWAKLGGSLSKAWGVIGPSKGGHWANVNERQSCPMVTQWTLFTSIDPEEGGHRAKQRGGAPVSWPNVSAGPPINCSPRPSRPFYCGTPHLALIRNY